MADIVRIQTEFTNINILPEIKELNDITLLNIECEHSDDLGFYNFSVTSTDFDDDLRNHDNWDSLREWIVNFLQNKPQYEIPVEATA